MTDIAFTICWAFALAPVVTWLVNAALGLIDPATPGIFALQWAIVAGGGEALTGLVTPWPVSAGLVLSLAAALAVWRWRRRKRRSVSALLGEKSRQLRAALVSRMRESARPRMVLRPGRVPA